MPAAAARCTARPGRPLTKPMHDARRQVEAYCQSLVEAGKARWDADRDGAVQLHLRTGEVYLFDEYGLTRLT